MRNVILIGFMGTGKTTIATQLAHRLKLRYVSTDDMIEKRQKCTINELFTERGEEYFRDVESAVVAEACSMSGVVIDAGGGACIREENMAAMKSGGIVLNPRRPTRQDVLALYKKALG